MKEYWLRLSARFDALAPRERTLVAAAAIAAVVFAFMSIGIDPALSRQKRLSQQLAETRQNVRNAENLLRARESQSDPDAVRRSYRDALRKQLAEIDNNMQGLQRRLVPPERMAQLLEDMLGKSRGLRLIALRTLPARRFDGPGAQGAMPPADNRDKERPADTERAIYQHAVELTLEGAYADLHDYLTRLERSELHMYWGRLALDAAGYPRIRATLTVHTLSLSKAWLIV